MFRNGMQELFLPFCCSRAEFPALSICACKNTVRENEQNPYCGVGKSNDSTSWRTVRVGTTLLIADRE